jgi:hypothetical protein
MEKICANTLSNLVLAGIALNAASIFLDRSMCWAPGTVRRGRGDSRILSQ